MKHEPCALGAVAALLLMSGVALADDWRTTICVPADLPPEMIYQTARPIDGFESTSIEWTAARGGQNAKCSLKRVANEGRSQQTALQVDYDFVGKQDYEYLRVSAPVEIPEPGFGFGFWLKWGGTSLPTRARIVDASGETHQIELVSNGTNEWQFVAGSLDGTSSSWGGDGNGRRDYPCRFDGILFDRPHRGFVGKGSLWIDDVALLRPREQPDTLVVESHNSPFGHLYAVGQSVSLRARGEGDQVRWQVRDYWGQTFSEGEGTGTGSAIQFRLERSGYFACRLELIRDGQAVEIQEYCCAALPVAAKPARSDFVGVCSHYGQNNYPLPSMNLMRSYGIDQFRDEISWRSFEPRPGKYAMPAHASAFLQQASELNMRPLIIFDYSNPNYDRDGFPNSPEAIAAFGRYAVELARQTRGTVEMFEVWNEWVGGCGMGNRPGDHGPEAYGRLLKSTYSVVKQAFPNVTVVGIGGEYGTHCADNVVGALSTAGAESMDAWSIHPYRYPRPPEQSELVGEVRRIADRVAETGATQPAWITEIGWPTHRTSGGSSERDQARCCVRSLALLQSTGKVQKVFWYDFKDDGTRRDYNEHNFGLIRHQTYHCAPKPGVVALSVFIRMTGDAQFVDLAEQNGCYAARYRRPNGMDVLVAWAQRGSHRVTVTGHVQSHVDIMGVEKAAAGVSELTEDPVYLIGKNLEINGLR